MRHRTKQANKRRFRALLNHDHDTFFALAMATVARQARTIRRLREEIATLHEDWLESEGENTRLLFLAGRLSAVCEGRKATATRLMEEVKKLKAFAIVHVDGCYGIPETWMCQHCGAGSFTRGVFTHKPGCPAE